MRVFPPYFFLLGRLEILIYSEYFYEIEGGKAREGLFFLFFPSERM